MDARAVIKHRAKVVGTWLLEFQAEIQTEFLESGGGITSVSILMERLQTAYIRFTTYCVVCGEWMVQASDEVDDPMCEVCLTMEEAPNDG